MTGGFQQKPDFSGNWTLNPRASTLSPHVAAAMQNGSLRIEHRDPTIAVHLRVMLDGKPVVRQDSSG